jgi:hypothetical protein
MCQATSSWYMLSHLFCSSLKLVCPGIGTLYREAIMPSIVVILEGEVWRLAGKLSNRKRQITAMLVNRHRAKINEQLSNCMLNHCCLGFLDEAHNR